MHIILLQINLFNYTIMYYMLQNYIHINLKLNENMYDIEKVPKYPQDLMSYTNKKLFLYDNNKNYLEHIPEDEVKKHYINECFKWNLITSENNFNLINSQITYKIFIDKYIDDNPYYYIITLSHYDAKHIPLNIRTYFYILQC